MLVSFKIVLNQFEISISIVIFSGFPKMIHKSLEIPTAVLFSFSFFSDAPLPLFWGNKIGRRPLIAYGI